MITIAYCIDSLWNCGGRERITTMKANYLAEHGFDVHIIQYEQNIKPPFYALSPQIKIHTVGIDTPYDVKGRWLLFRYLHHRKFWREFQQKYAILLEQIKADVVVSTFNEEFRYLHHVNDGSKKILETHFCRYYLWYKSACKGLKSRLYALYRIIRDKHIVRRFDAFVCLTNRDALSWRPMKNLHVIENPITISDNGIADTSLRRVIAVGRFEYQKSHDILVRCWAKIPAEIRKGWTLDIYGNGTLKPDVDQLIAKLGLQDSVRTHVPISAITEEYLKSSIYCSTSKYEGFSLAMCEAMSAGLPVVTFDHPCGASDMILDESMGMLVPMGREDLYVEKLQLLMTNHELRKSMGTNARKSIFERYSMEVIMQKWLALFNSLIMGTPAL